MDCAGLRLDSGLNLRRSLLDSHPNLDIIEISPEMVSVNAEDCLRINEQNTNCCMRVAQV
jgi:hypothetical protein